MPEPALEILFEDNHCIAVAKPVGVPSTHFQGGEETLDRAVKAYLKERYRKPGNVFLGVVHRLDKPVSGVLLFARTSKAAARLSEQFREGTIEKVYWAVVEGEWPIEAGSLEDWLRKGREAGRDAPLLVRANSRTPDTGRSRRWTMPRKTLPGLPNFCFR